MFYLYYKTSFSNLEVGFIPNIIYRTALISYQSLLETKRVLITLLCCSTVVQCINRGDSLEVFPFYDAKTLGGAQQTVVML